MDAAQDRITMEVTGRFFQALRELIARGAIRGVNSFTAAYGINRRNLLAAERGGSTQKYAQTAWLSLISRDCGVSARWLLTGEGEMFDREPSPPPGTERPRRASRRDGD